VTSDHRVAGSAEDRPHRIGAKDNVLVQHLVLVGSLDAGMVRRILKKQEILDLFWNLEEQPMALTVTNYGYWASFSAFNDSGRGTSSVEVHEIPSFSNFSRRAN